MKRSSTLASSIVLATCLVVLWTTSAKGEFLPQLPGPSPAEIEAGKEAYARFGATYSYNVRNDLHLFSLPSRTRDDQLKELPDLPFPFGISLAASPVTDAGLVHLQRLKNLKSLNLFNTLVTGPGLQDLRSLDKLESLNLTDTEITDGGLAYLQGFKNLKHLLLGINNISDAGLTELKRFKSLEYIDLKDSNVTRQGVEELKKSQPAFRIGGFR